jgi:hypothetical protein
MKRAFVRTSTGHLVSALVPINTPNVLNVGDRVAASRVLDMGYAGKIRRGEQGTVDFIDEHTGTIWILMDINHRGLSEWHNHLWLEPYGTEDIIDGILCVLCNIATLRSVA